METNLTKKQAAELRAFDRFIAEVGTADMGRTILAEKAMAKALRKAARS